MNFLFRDAEGEALCPQGSVVCIGAFDGLHLGHQALLHHAHTHARQLQLPVVALSFEPLPREFFARDTPPGRLMLARDKLQGFARAGMDGVGLLRFDARMAAMPAETFVAQVLQRRLGARAVWVGPEFHFGHQRRGDLALLQAEGEKHHFTAHAIAPVMYQGERISSSRIRAVLADGDFALAAACLGQSYRISGRVVHGRKLGRKLGFPTANLRFTRHPPMQGIYAVRVHGVAATPYAAVASFGTRPTVAGDAPLLEVHLFDFSGDLYGQLLEVEFIAKLRDEEKFASLDALAAQMRQDALLARSLLAARRSPDAVENPHE
ncbi:bifunctional riboflavin kinase/FMN adenylyltransferase [Lysobacteraceae bacterium NML08-0793]|nr:bifunctional riboflavin kinase/FMN adenylyltransferase [Xanthomonadaceae bacterium NML08-0793]